jgi:hypothetical protein
VILILDEAAHGWDANVLVISWKGKCLEVVL